jgi:hypothetical protein
MGSWASSVDNYNQLLLQNASNGLSASTNFVVSNDTATNSTNYGEFGMNSSNYNKASVGGASGASGAFIQPNTVYLSSQSSDLAIGTYGLNPIHFVVNSGSTDAMTINTNNSVSINGGLQAGIGATGYVGATGVGAPTGYFNNIYLSGVQVPQKIAGATGGVVASITPSSTYETYVVNALGATGATINAPSGTPYDGQKLVIRIKDDGTIRGLVFSGATGAYRTIGTTLPSATTANKVLYIGCQYNALDTFWDIVAVTQQT